MKENTSTSKSYMQPCTYVINITPRDVIMQYSQYTGKPEEELD